MAIRFTGDNSISGEKKSSSSISSSSTSSTKIAELTSSAIALLIAFLTGLFMIYIMHIIVFPKPEIADLFQPQLTCTKAPIECWDGFSKSHGDYCTKVHFDTPLRGSKAILPASSQNCYKSIYFNFDQNTMYILGLLLAWYTLVLKSMERLVSVLVRGKLRPIAAFSFLFSMPILWYIYSVPMHYVNDRYYKFLSSQMFFNLTDSLVATITALHFDASQPAMEKLLTLSASISLYHIVQIMLDEYSMLFSKVRNVYMLSSDLITLITTLSILGFFKWREMNNRIGVIRSIVVGSLIWMATFNLFFADKASNAFGG